MNRRQYIQTLGCAGGVTLAGCLFDENETPVASLAGISFQNYSFESFEVEIEARKNGTEVYTDTITIEATSVEERQDGDDIEVMGGAILVEEWMGTTAQYEIEITVPEYELEASFDTAERSRLHSDDHDGECYKIRVFFENSEDILSTEKPPDVISAEVSFNTDHDVYSIGECRT